jgi:hypothetical protein
MFPPAWRNPEIRKNLQKTGRELFLHEELNSTPVLGIALYDLREECVGM